MNNNLIGIAGLALAVLLIGTVAIMTIDVAFATSKNTGVSTQRNSCGNNDLPSNISCRNIDSSSHGRDNAVVVNATQQ
jgi:hypothetical protein